jgi:hypothetical protein
MVPTGSLPANCRYDCHATRTSRSLLCMAVRCATGRANTHLATNHTRRRKRGGLPVASGICVRKQPTRCNEEDCQSDGRGTCAPDRRALVTKRQGLALLAICAAAATAKYHGDWNPGSAPHHPQVVSNPAADLPLIPRYSLSTVFPVAYRISLGEDPPLLSVLSRKPW